MSDHPHVSTSEPIYKAAATVGAAVTALLGLVGSAIALGVLTTDQGAAVTAAGEVLLSALPQLAGAVTLIVALVTGVAASLATAWSARKKVVPLDSDAHRITPAPSASTLPDVGHR